MQNLDIILKGAIKISQAAAEVILQVYNHEAFQVQMKSDASPLTIADERANDLICKMLMELTPDIPIISEENIEIEYEKRRHFKYFWSVDPLDGTKEFVKRNGEFTVNIALLENNIPILGVIAVPVQQSVYYAVKNKGSFLLKNGVVQKMICSVFRLADAGLRIPISRSAINKETSALIASYNQPVLSPTGSALKFMYLAEGHLDIYPRVGTTMEWDTAAAQIILEEAGGQLLDLQTRHPLLYNKVSLKNPDFIAHGTILNGGENN